MRRKGIFTILAAVFMVLAFSAMAFAANQAFMKTTVPNIPKSACWQAGTDTFEIDNGTVMDEGDVIQLTLNNGVTLCKAINMFVTIAPTGGALDPTAAQPVSDVTGGTVTAAGAGTQFGFVVTGPVGSQIITLTLRRVTTATGTLIAAPVFPIVNTMTYTEGAAGGKMSVKLFDGKVGVFAASGINIWTAGTTYFTGAVASDNILCINTLLYAGEYVQNTPNSIPIDPIYRLSFSGDYTIAHIMGTSGFSVVSCTKPDAGRLQMGKQGQPDTCNSFKYELTDGLANEYCAPYNRGLTNRLIIAAQTGTTFTADNYRVRMDVVVERGGVAKTTPGVYWSLSAAGNEVGWAAATSLANACAAVSAPIVYLGNPYTYLRASGAAAAPRVPAFGNCDLTAAEKAVELTTPVATAIAIPGTATHLYIDMPYLNYDPDEILSGDVVKIRVWLLAAGCSVIGPLDIAIGTFGCIAGAAGPSMCTFPYFTALGADTWWNGIALVNKTDASGTVNLRAYKNDGTQATAAVVIPARQMYVNLLENMVWTGTMPAGVKVYIEASSTDITVDAFGNSRLDGFGMMANEANNDSMGYLCRTPGN